MANQTGLVAMGFKMLHNEVFIECIVITENVAITLPMEPNTKLTKQ